MLLTIQGPLESLAQFLTALLIFLFVVAITWFTTRYIAKFQKQTMTGSNIEIIETTKISPNKYLQIIRAGGKYLLIAVCKDTVTMLSELSEEDIVLRMPDDGAQLDFHAVMDKAKQRLSGGKKEKEQEKSDEE